MSGKPASRASAVILAVVGLAACQTDKAILSEEFGNDAVLATKADYRTITRTTVADKSGTGPVKPGVIVCAEPSPDVAKAVSESFQLDSKIAAEIAGQGGGSLAFAMARQRAEAIAQMTQRLATIQLLRDGMYRACEAYANGALSKMEYAVILSRYDDTMVTLMLGELAAGNFGGTLASLGTIATSQTGEVEKATESAKEAMAALDEQMAGKQTDLKSLDSKIADTKEKIKTVEGEEKDKLEADLVSSTEKRERLAREVEDLKTYKALAAKAAVQGSALAISLRADVTGPRQGAAALETAKILESMQKNYLHDINMDAVETACISALGGMDASKADTALAAHCRESIPAFQKAKNDLLLQLLERGKLWVEIDALEEAVKRIKAYQGTVEDLRKSQLRSTPPYKGDRLVEAVQRLLEEAGHKVGAIDGILGPLTMTAIREFEEKNPDVTRYEDNDLYFLLGLQKAVEKLKTAR